MILDRLFAPRAALRAGRTLYSSAARQARSPRFYERLGVRDTPEGRFELFTLHVALVVLRLKGCGAAAAETSQHLFEAYVRALDDALREMGVGDLSVPKRMKGLGEAFYGRVRALEQAMADKDAAAAALAELMQRTALEGSAEGRPEALAAYVLAARDALARTPLEALLEARLTWPDPASLEAEG